METYLLSISLARHRQVVPVRRSDRSMEHAELDFVVRRPFQADARELDHGTAVSRRLTDGEDAT
jgi:hypothetical protein